MEIKRLGHVVLRVKNLDIASDFYNGLLNIPISARSDEMNMLFFTLGENHNLAVRAVGDEASTPYSEQTGLDHVALELNGGIESLRAANATLESAGVSVIGIDHVVSKSIYFNDPDGNGVELFIDSKADWKDNPDLILSTPNIVEQRDRHS